jgi:aspartyl-tRNA(Asn)/glutamyl-tRNA(Gln) amidotransferase subunit C
MISEENVKKISKLCRLKIEDKDLAYISGQLSNIMDMIKQLEEVNTDNVQPLNSVCEVNVRMRQDIVTSDDLRDDLFSNIPGERADFAKEIKCFIVPKVVE